MITELNELKVNRPNKIIWGVLQMLCCGCCGCCCRP